MSHSVQNAGSTNMKYALVTIINYTQGGEQFTVADFPSVLVIVSALPGQVAASANSLGVPLFPVLDGGKVKLYEFVSGSPTEIPTTTALNAVIPVVLFCGS